MPEILYCDEKCVNKLSSVFGSLTSDEITNDLLSAKDKVISKMAHKVAAFGNLDGEEMMKIFDFLFSHSSQLACSLSIIMALGVIIALSSSGIAKRFVNSIAGTLNALLLFKVMLHYRTIMKVCEEVSKMFPGDGLSGYALVGYLYSPILLIVELSAIFVLTYTIFGKSIRNMSQGGAVIKVFVFLLFFTCWAMIGCHTLLSIGEVKPERILTVMDVNMNLSIITASIVITTDFFFLICMLTSKVYAGLGVVLKNF